ncbi:hypothetical protein AgCh_028792 [Apium graveolens]
MQKFKSVKPLVKKRRKLRMVNESSSNDDETATLISKLHIDKKYHKTQEPESKRDSTTDIDPVPQEPHSQSESADIHTTRTIPDNAQGGTTANPYRSNPDTTSHPDSEVVESLKKHSRVVFVKPIIALLMDAPAADEKSLPHMDPDKAYTTDEDISNDDDANAQILQQPELTNILKGIHSSVDGAKKINEGIKSSMDARLVSLEAKVDGLDTKLDVILSLSLSHTHTRAHTHTQSVDVKKGEKASSTKCTPELILRNDDNKAGNDGGKENETSDVTRVDVAMNTVRYGNANNYCEKPHICLYNNIFKPLQ